MIKDMEVECKTKFSMDVEFSFSFKPAVNFPPTVLTGTSRDGIIHIPIYSIGNQKGDVYRS